MPFRMAIRAAQPCRPKGAGAGPLLGPCLPTYVLLLVPIMMPLALMARQVTSAQEQWAYRGCTTAAWELLPPMQ